MDSLLDDLRRHYAPRTPHMREAGIETTTVAPALGAMTMAPRHDWLGDAARGLVHPGVLTVLADSTCGLAVGAALEKRQPYATLDLRMDYLRAAVAGQGLHCEAHCHRRTPNVAFVHAEVWQQQRDQPVASASATFMLSTPRGKRPLDKPGAESDAAPAWQPPADMPVAEALARSPYVAYLDIRQGHVEGQPVYRLPYHERLIGNPFLPALHGGVVAGFAETAATLAVMATRPGAPLPRGIDFSIDYLRSGRPEDCFAGCELVRLGGRAALVLVRCWQRQPQRPIAVARVHFLLAASEAEGPRVVPGTPQSG
jgi:uncharacterized protein (TIGR00369 family)